MSEGLLEQAVQIVTQEKYYARYLPKSLSILLPYLKRDQQSQWATHTYDVILRELEEDVYHFNPHAAIIADLLPYLPAELRNTALLNGLKAVTDCAREDDRVAGLIRFIPHLPLSEQSQFIEQVFRSAQALGIGYGRALHLSALFPYLSIVQKDQALPDILAASQYWLVNAVSTLMLHLTDSKMRGETLQRGFETALAKGGIGQLAPFLDKPLLQQALDAQLQITHNSDEEGRCWALIALLPYLQEPQKEALIRWVFNKQFTQLESSYPQFRSKILIALAEYLPDDLLHLAFEETLQMTRHERPSILTKLLPRLTAAESARALASMQIRGSWDDFQIPSEIARLAPHLVGPSQEEAVHLAAPQIFAQRPVYTMPYEQLSSDWQQSARDHEMSFSFHLSQIVGQLHGSELLQAFELVMQLIGAHYRAENLVLMIPNLPPEQQQIAVQDVFELNKSGPFIQLQQDILTPIMPYLTDAMRQEILEVAYTLGEKEAGVFVMRRLIPTLPETEKETVRNQALETCKALYTEYGSRARHLIALLPQLDEARAAEAVRIAVSDLLKILSWRRFNSSNISALIRLMPLAENRVESLQRLRETAATHTMILQTETRDNALEFCATFGEVASLSLFSNEIHSKIAGTILDICETWQWL